MALIVVDKFDIVGKAGFVRHIVASLSLNWQFDILLYRLEFLNRWNDLEIELKVIDNIVIQHF